jgi:multidrug transporter EmrE-like cation transporter
MFLFWTFAAALAFAVGSAFMKASDGMIRSWPALAMYLTFAAGATFQALALREAELGVAYMFSLGRTRGMNTLAGSPNTPPRRGASVRP